MKANDHRAGRRRARRTMRRTRSEKRRRTIRKPSSSPVSQAIVRVAPPPPKPWLLTTEEVAILKNAVCKGATDEEMKYCLAVARRYELDPFQQQIWFVPRWDSRAIMANGQQGGIIWQPQVGINGLLNIAARDHKDFGSYSEPEYGPMIEVTYRKNGEGPVMKLMVPEWARIGTLKKGDREPTVARVWWEEIYENIDRAPLVRRMPRLMLAKCAKAQVTRTAYPKTGGLLIPEECYNKEFTQFTPEGRIYSDEPPDQALERYKEKEKEGLGKLTDAQREVVEKRMKNAEEKKGSSTPVATNAEFIEVHYASDAAEFVGLQGSAMTLLRPFVERECNGVWSEDGRCWSIPVAEVKKLRESALAIGVSVREIEDWKSSAAPDPRAVPPTHDESAEAGKTHNPLVNGRESAADSRPSTGFEEIAGFVMKVRDGVTSEKKVPYLDVQQGRIWRSTYNKDLFPYLKEAVGKDCVFLADPKTKKIVGIVRIGNRMFADDGKTPEIQNSEPRPQTTADLFK